MQFDDTRIYQRSLELIDITKAVLAELPSGYGFLADQLRRSSSSVVLNFAEGYGKHTKRDQRPVAISNIAKPLTFLDSGVTGCHGFHNVMVRLTRYDTCLL